MDSNAARIFSILLSRANSKVRLMSSSDGGDHDDTARRYHYGRFDPLKGLLEDVKTLGDAASATLCLAH